MRALLDRQVLDGYVRRHRVLVLMFDADSLASPGRTPGITTKRAEARPVGT
jgi:hypothetical protein